MQLLVPVKERNKYICRILGHNVCVCVIKMLGLENYLGDVISFIFDYMLFIAVEIGIEMETRT